MKKILICLLVLLSISYCAYAKELDIKSEAAVLIDAKTGQILYEKNKDEKLYPASITKIMTIYLACTQDKDKLITVSKTAVDSVPKDTSNIALDYGEKITLEQAMYAAMLMSANDACNVIAESVSGNMKSFTELMTKTAKEMGTRNTNFVNANGLVDKNHYTTAADFALITRQAIKNPEFLKIFSSVEYTIPKTNKKTDERNFVSQHRMMHWQQYADLDVIGGKTGYTLESLHTLVTYGKKNGNEVIAVVLKAPDFNSVYSDTKKLLEHGYNDFKKVVISSEDVEKHIDGLTTYIPQGKASFMLENSTNKKSLKYRYSEKGVDIISPNGEKLGLLGVKVEVKTPMHIIILRTIGIVFGLIVLILIVIYINLIVSTRKKRKRRKLNNRSA